MNYINKYFQKQPKQSNLTSRIKQLLSLKNKRKIKINIKKISMSIKEIEEEYKNK